MSTARIRQLKPGDPIPSGTPKRYPNDRGYIRLRWRIASKMYVECYEHRLACGLPAGKVIHHENRIKSDNRPQNLKPLTHSEHMKGCHGYQFDVDEAARLYEQGFTTTALAEMFGTFASSVVRAFHDRGIECRTRGQSRRVAVSYAAVLRLHVADIPAPEIAERLGGADQRGAPRHS